MLMTFQRFVDEHPALIPVIKLVILWFVVSAIVSLSAGGSRCRDSIAHERRSTERNGDGRAPTCDG